MKQKREVRLNELHDQFLCQAFFVTNFHSQINVVVLVVCRCFVEWVKEEAHCFSHFFRYCILQMRFLVLRLMPYIIRLCAAAASFSSCSSLLANRGQCGTGHPLLWVCVCVCVCILFIHFDILHFPCNCLSQNFDLQLIAQLVFITPACFGCRSQYMHSWSVHWVFETEIFVLLKIKENSSSAVCLDATFSTVLIIRLCCTL